MDIQEDGCEEGGGLLLVIAVDIHSQLTSYNSVDLHSNCIKYKRQDRGKTISSLMSNIMLSSIFLLLLVLGKHAVQALKTKYNIYYFVVTFKFFKNALIY